MAGTCPEPTGPCGETVPVPPGRWVWGQAQDSGRQATIGLCAHGIPRVFVTKAGQWWGEGGRRAYLALVPCRGSWPQGFRQLLRRVKWVWGERETHLSF